MKSIVEMQAQILLNILRELGMYPDAFTQDEKTANAAMCIMVKQLEMLRVERSKGRGVKNYVGLVGRKYT